jgi:hypothetical protein
MPGNWVESDESRAERRRRAYEKLARLGINPRSLKYDELFIRYMRKS